MIKVYQMPSEVIEATDAFPMFYGKGRLFDLEANIQHYVHVADLDVEDLNEAFEVGNIGPEEKYTRYQRMHSVSVGDILVKESGDTFVVAGFGFDQIDLEVA